jgi:hypothetical protein
MKLTFIRKTNGSINGSCPALYSTDDGRYVVQGKLLGDDERAQLRDLAADETAVVVPADVIAGIVNGA